jgi:SAM-dependent methyltransferase
VFPHATFDGVDSDMASLLIALKLNDNLGHDRYTLTCSAGESLPFDDGTFDLVVSFSTLEHVDGEACQRAFLGECYRVLRRGGLALLTFPNRWNVFFPEEHTGVPWLGCVPERLRQPYCRAWSGMPGDDIHPLSYGRLRAVLRQLGIDTYDVYSYHHDYPNPRLRRLFRTGLYLRWGPGYHLVMPK